MRAARTFAGGLEADGVLTGVDQRERDHGEYTRRHLIRCGGWPRVVVGGKRTTADNSPFPIGQRQLYVRVRLRPSAAIDQVQPHRDGAGHLRVQIDAGLSHAKAWTRLYRRHFTPHPAAEMSQGVSRRCDLRKRIQKHEAGL